jgi:NAD-dependent deacetylase
VAEGSLLTDAATQLIEAATLLRKAQHICVLTGAGISAESGIPTFRDAMTGLWATFRPEDLASPDAFARDPKFVWDWYESRRARVRQVEPNPGHHALVALACTSGPAAPASSNTTAIC